MGGDAFSGGTKGDATKPVPSGAIATGTRKEPQKDVTSWASAHQEQVWSWEKTSSIFPRTENQRVKQTGEDS